jgi:Uma2 family endonuclease
MLTLSSVQAPLTLEAFLSQPENKPYAEYINGRIEQKLMPQGEHSILQIRLGAKINEVGLPTKLAHAFTELRCNFNDRSLVPDLSIFSWHRLPLTETGKIANRINTYPDWIIEILSPEQSPNKIIEKIIFCLRAGSQLAWLIDPQDESVLIFEKNQFPELKSGQDILPTLKDLSALQLTVEDLFSWLHLS